MVDSPSIQQRIDAIKMEIARSVTQSRYFKQKSCTYDAPRRAMPARVKKLIRELDSLEKERDTP